MNLFCWGFWRWDPVDPGPHEISVHLHSQQMDISRLQQGMIGCLLQKDLLQGTLDLHPNSQRPHTTAFPRPTGLHQIIFQTPSHTRIISILPALVRFFTELEHGFCLRIHFFPAVQVSLQVAAVQIAAAQVALQVVAVQVVADVKRANGSVVTLFISRGARVDLPFSGKRATCCLMEEQQSQGTLQVRVKEHRETRKKGKEESRHLFLRKGRRKRRRREKEKRKKREGEEERKKEENDGRM